MAKQPAKGAPKPGGEGDLEILKKLVAMLDGANITSIKLQRGDVSYEVSRLGAMPVFPHEPPHALVQALSAPAPASAVAAGPAPAAALATLIEIKSPMVGTFYRAPEPGAEPYVKPGSRIAPGQTLCIIEAMKIMNELESEVSGTVREMLVEEAQPVEFGQVLFRVEP